MSKVRPPGLCPIVGHVTHEIARWQGPQNFAGNAWRGIVFAVDDELARDPELRRRLDRPRAAALRASNLHPSPGRVRAPAASTSAR